MTYSMGNIRRVEWDSVAARIHHFLTQKKEI